MLPPGLGAARWVSSEAGGAWSKGAHTSLRPCSRGGVCPESATGLSPPGWRGPGQSMRDSTWPAQRRLAGGAGEGGAGRLLTPQVNRWGPESPPGPRGGGGVCIIHQRGRDRLAWSGLTLRLLSSQRGCRRPPGPAGQRLAGHLGLKPHPGGGQAGTGRSPPWCRREWNHPSCLGCWVPVEATLGATELQRRGDRAGRGPSQEVLGWAPRPQEPDSRERGHTPDSEITVKGPPNCAQEARGPHQGFSASEVGPVGQG